MEGEPTPISTRRCDFVETLRALEELGGSRVGVEVLPRDAAAPFLSVIGRLDRAWAIGGRDRAALAVEIGEAILRISTTTFLTATRETYADGESGLRWRLLAIELRSGMVIEIQEIPRGPGGRG